MANDLVTRLTLNNKEFENNLSKSTKQINDFKRQNEEISRTVSAAFSGMAKMAGGIGIALSVKEGFDKFINSSQTTADAFNNNIEAMKGSVNAFFTALNTGDWSGFDGIYDKAKRLQEILDQLGNSQISLSYFDSKFNANTAQLREIVTDKESSQTQIAEALQEWRSVIAEKAEMNNVVKSDLLSAISAKLSLNNALDKNNLTLEDFEAVLKIDVTANRDDLKKQMNEELKDYDKQYGEISNRYEKLKKDYTYYSKSGLFNEADKRSDIPSRQIMDSELNILKTEMQTLNEAYKSQILYREGLVKLSDEELQDLSSKAQEYNNLNKAISDNQRLLNRTEKGLGKTTTTTGGTTKGETKTNGVFFDFPDTSDIDDRMLAIQQKLDSKPLILKALVEEEEAEDIFKVLDEMQQEFYSKQMVNLNNNISALSSMTSMFDSMSAILNKTGNDMAAWGIQSLGTIAQVIAQYATLQAQALAAGVAQQAALPFPFNLAAAAATVGGIVSIITSIPKFESGGIVGGSSFYGDNVLARVNSGEMILNKGQQANLFNMLNNGSPGPNGGNVTFRISGSDLVGTLNNHNSRTSKFR